MTTYRNTSPDGSFCYVRFFTQDNLDYITFRNLDIEMHTDISEFMNVSCCNHILSDEIAGLHSPTEHQHSQVYRHSARHIIRCIPQVTSYL